jgi:hypothetical protein
VTKIPSELCIGNLITVLERGEENIFKRRVVRRSDERPPLFLNYVLISSRIAVRSSAPPISTISPNSPVLYKASKNAQA